MAKKKMTLTKYLKEMKKLLIKAPRAGIKPTKVIKDKTKYSRKEKHKKWEDGNA